MGPKRLDTKKLFSGTLFLLSVLSMQAQSNEQEKIKRLEAHTAEISTGSSPHINLFVYDKHNKDLMKWQYLEILHDINRYKTDNSKANSIIALVNEITKSEHARKAFESHPAYDEMRRLPNIDNKFEQNRVLNSVLNKFKETPWINDVRIEDNTLYELFPLYGSAIPNFHSVFSHRQDFDFDRMVKPIAIISDASIKPERILSASVDKSKLLNIEHTGDSSRDRVYNTTEVHCRDKTVLNSNDDDTFFIKFSTLADRAESTVFHTPNFDMQYVFILPKKISDRFDQSSRDSWKCLYNYPTGSDMTKAEAYEVLLNESLVRLVPYARFNRIYKDKVEFLVEKLVVQYTKDFYPANHNLHPAAPKENATWETLEVIEDSDYSESLFGVDAPVTPVAPKLDEKQLAYLQSSLGENSNSFKAKAVDSLDTEALMVNLIGGDITKDGATATLRVIINDGSMRKAEYNMTNNDMRIGLNLQSANFPAPEDLYISDVDWKTGYLYVDRVGSKAYKKQESITGWGIGHFNLIKGGTFIMSVNLRQPYNFEWR